MIKTYADFVAVCDSKCDLYARIPESHLSFEGSNTYELYRAVKWNAGFAGTASELLELLNSDDDVAKTAEYAKSEHRQIVRCLERLASEESRPPVVRGVAE